MYRRVTGGCAAVLHPAVCCGSQGHRNATAIAALNLLLGWTVLGWIGSLVWSLTANTEPATK
ncbi:TPA: superinfection immunity protein [Aeromonas veronii]